MKIPSTRQIHGSYDDRRAIACQGAGLLKMKTHMKPDNPLTSKGKKVMHQMEKQYGNDKAERVFYASINKGLKGSKGWHK